MKASQKHPKPDLEAIRCANGLENRIQVESIATGACDNLSRTRRNEMRYRQIIYRSLHLLLGLLVVALFSVSLSDRSHTDSEHLHDMSFEEFREFKSARNRIRSDSVNMTMLEAAVFHHANRQRSKLGLKPVRYSRKLSEMARQHSSEMASLGYLSHTSPLPPYLSLADRLAAIGLLNIAAAENIAVHPAMVLGSGEYRLEIDPEGVEIWVDRHTLRARDFYTYFDFGEALVKQWMVSPGHRDNLIGPQWRYAGYGGGRGDYKGSDCFYFTQCLTTDFRAVE